MGRGRREGRRGGGEGDKLGIRSKQAYFQAGPKNTSSSLKKLRKGGLGTEYVRTISRTVLKWCLVNRKTDI